VGTASIPVSVTHTLGELSILGFAPDGSIYVELQELIDGAVFLVDQTVRHYASDGRLLGLARVPLATQYTPVGHALAVGPDGAVYALGTRPAGAEILRLRFGPTLAPLAQPAPTEPAPNRSPAPATGWTDYADPQGRWRVSYPASLLTPQDLGNGLVIFISADRGHFVGIDSGLARGAPDDPGLCERAAQALATIYSIRPATITPLAALDAP
jgi:hypothetical protein